MWIRTVSGWKFFEVEHTPQGFPYATKINEKPNEQRKFTRKFP